jgi:hypothetical protein
MFHVVLEEVPLHTDVFDLLVDQGVLGVYDRALVILPYGGCFSDVFVEDLPLELAKVESLLGSVRRTVILCLAG